MAAEVVADGSFSCAQKWQHAVLRRSGFRVQPKTPAYRAYILYRTLSYTNADRNGARMLTACSDVGLLMLVGYQHCIFGHSLRSTDVL